MRLNLFLTSIHLVLTCVNGSTSIKAGHVARQDVTETTEGATATVSSTSSASIHTTASLTTTSSAISSSSTPASNSTTVATTSATASTIGSGSVTTSSSTTSSLTSPAATEKPSQTDGLPLQPRISPAVGIAGAILMVAGLALAFVGIKHDWLHVFLSTSLLVALAVTILVIYVMNPPVSDAVQGAYFVAAFMTGIIVGGISLVFREITESLAGLLGGFCLAMWLLVLRNGGLIRSQTGRGILIGVFCAVPWAFTFLKFTRDQALIFCTAFAGATVTVLGIDCFSRAGLKEFWIYIWNLNNNEFPLGTTTYPMSRGIRVEIAAIVILTLLGLFSQIKIWKMILQNRDVSDAIQLREDEHREQAESRIAERVQRYNARYLKLWEATYSKSHDKNNDVGVQEHPLDDLSEAHSNIDFSRRSSKNIGASTSTIAVDPSLEQADLYYYKKDISRSNSAVSSRVSLPPPPSHGSTERLVRPPVASKRRSTYSSLAPEIIPPVPKVPSRPTSRVVWSRRTSARESQLYIHAVAAVAVDPRVTDTTANRLSKQSLEGAAVSSIAATCNDVADLDTLSQHRLSRLYLSATVSRAGSAAGSSNNNRASFIEEPVDEHDDEIISKGIEPIGENTGKEAQSGNEESRLSTSNVNAQSTEGSTAVESQVVQELTADALSAQFESKVSKFATTYRTNEWAKHIEEAEEPQDQDLTSASPGLHIDPAFTQEAVKPVDILSLGSRPSSFQAEPAIRRTVSSTYLQGNATGTQTNIGSARSTSVKATKQVAVRPKTPVQVSRRSSRMSMQSYDGQAMPFVGRPLAQQTVPEYGLTPVPQAYRPLSGDQYRPGSAFKPGLHVIAPSDTASLAPDRVRSPEQSLVNLAEQAYNIPSTAVRVGSRPPSRAQGLDNMSIVNGPFNHHTQTTSNPAARPWTATGNSSLSRQTSMNGRPQTARQSSIIYDSHQPKREHGIDLDRQAALQAQWRESLRHSYGSTQAAFTTHDAAQTTMLNERRQTEWWAQQEQAERVGRQSAMDMAMRSGQMHDAHREAMRRMQAQASRGSQG